MDQPYHLDRDQVEPASIMVRPAQSMPQPSASWWEVVRDGEVVHSASTKGGALDYAHGLTGSPLAQQR